MWEEWHNSGNILKVKPKELLTCSFMFLRLIFFALKWDNLLNWVYRKIKYDIYVK